LRAKFDDFDVGSIFRKLTYPIGHRRFAKNSNPTLKAQIWPQMEFCKSLNKLDEEYRRMTLVKQTDTNINNTINSSQMTSEQGSCLKLNQLEQRVYTLTHKHFARIDNEADQLENNISSLTKKLSLLSSELELLQNEINKMDGSSKILGLSLISTKKAELENIETKIDKANLKLKNITEHPLHKLNRKQFLDGLETSYNDYIKGLELVDKKDPCDYCFLLAEQGYNLSGIIEAVKQADKMHRQNTVKSKLSAHSQYFSSEELSLHETLIIDCPHDDQTLMHDLVIKLLKQVAQDISKYKIIKELLQQHTPPLKSIDLSGITPTDTLLGLIQELKTLTSINLQGSFEITDEGIENLEKLPNLTKLNLRSCKKLTNKTLESLKKFPNLMTLDVNFTHCRQITQKDLNNFTKEYPDLTCHFYFYEDSKIEEKLIQVIEKNNQTQLKKIIIDLFQEATKSTNKLASITELLKQHTPPLKKLNLSKTKLNNEVLDPLFEQLPTLQSLKFQDCTWLTDEGLESIENLHNLTTLNLKGCRNLTKEGLECLEELKLTSLIPPINDDVEKAYNEIAFGNDKWIEAYGVEIKEEDIGKDLNALPENILEILESTCPTDSSKKIKNTHMLVWMPQTIIMDGKEQHLTLNILGQLIKKKYCSKSEKGYSYFNSQVEKEIGDKTLTKGQWVLMTKDAIEGSKNQDYYTQQKLVNDLAEKSGMSYELPTLLEATVCILAQYVSKGCLFRNSYGARIRCQENLEGSLYQVMVGGHNPIALSLERCDYNDNGNGVAARWKFF
jgi:hypothetical protein